MPDSAKKTENKRLPFHVALTATDEPYSKWQSRIMYYWYKKKKDLPGSDMGKFTRILHSGKPDNLMDEIPTFVVNPLPTVYYFLEISYNYEGMLIEPICSFFWSLFFRELSGYVVLNRPWAFVQWLKKSTIEEEYILMAEPDHIFLKPLPNLGHEGYPAAFPFFYIRPVENVEIIRKFYPEEMGPITDIDPIGNSPVIIRKVLLEKIAPTWMNVSLKMKNDPETDTTFGWVLEIMIFLTFMSFVAKQKYILRKDFMSQPPWDLETRNKFILHYTYGCDYTLKGELTYGKIGEWRFDKRAYLNGPPPLNLSLPPRGVPESVKLFMSLLLNASFYEKRFRLAYLQVTLVKLINEATANIPNWDTTEGT
ncbi:hypothetical protein CDL12_29385 [Handroanthus impetiginosus]|uniref:Hydroxyproline O-arabinosyltransferase-like domain-containing protein n=1 Tax=Handroanthus impetiginosus TaxID=429701 RepID=A0A2G9FYK0_9LAMI|nr:hypothetical protein CDL12_29385 [Handroanthus impetiginosus]